MSCSTSLWFAFYAIIETKTENFDPVSYLSKAYLQPKALTNYHAGNIKIQRLKRSFPTTGNRKNLNGS